jgi:hypothetical protein
MLRSFTHRVAKLDELSVLVVHVGHQEGVGMTVNQSSSVKGDHKLHPSAVPHHIHLGQMIRLEEERGLL